MLDTSYPTDLIMKSLLPVLFLAIGLTGCYHTTVVMDAEPSDEFVEEKWAPSWIGGLVPPEDIDASACSDGAAVVETRLSFANMFVGALTGGIFTPMHIKVTCAL